MITIRTTPQPECPECFTATDFCPHCGEKKHVPSDFSRRKFFASVFADFTDIDTKFFKTLFLLTFRPGFLSTEYSRGIHVHYIKPFRLFVMIALVHFLAFGLSSSADIFNMQSVYFPDRFGLYNRLINSGIFSGVKPAFTDPVLLDKEIKNILSFSIYIVIFMISAFLFLFSGKETILHRTPCIYYPYYIGGPAEKFSFDPGFHDLETAGNSNRYRPESYLCGYGA